MRLIYFFGIDVVRDGNLFTVTPIFHYFTLLNINRYRCFTTQLILPVAPRYDAIARKPKPSASNKFSKNVRSF